MLALEKGDLPLSIKLESHLAHCLTCRACEKICPSYVPYGQILDSTRALIKTMPSSAKRRPLKTLKILHWFIKNRKRIEIMNWLLFLYQRSGMRRFLKMSRLLQYFGISPLDENLTAVTTPQSFATIYPAKTPATKRVDLFIGCVASITDRQTLIASIRLLNRLGYEVRVPPTQTCCGALHLHHGDKDNYAKMVRKNIQAFSDGTETILCTASGCTATLAEYGNYFKKTENQSSQRFSNRVMDISHFLANFAWPAHFSFRPLAKRIAVHDPCTLTNVLRQEKNPYALLTQIPGAEIVPLPGNNQCCGAAGTYHLTESQIAQQLRAIKIAQLEKLAPDILVTSNPGCAMYLTAGMRKAGLAIEVVHPLVLLERQMEETSHEHLLRDISKDIVGT